MGGNKPASAILWLGGSLLWLVWAGLLSLIAGMLLGMAGLHGDYLIPAGTAVGGTAAFVITYMGLKARREGPQAT